MDEPEGAAGGRKVQAGQAEKIRDAVVTVEAADAPGPIVLVCEHASNAFPPDFGTLGLDPAAQVAHVAWDPGALGLARGLSRRLAAPLVAARVSRLIYDLNRPPQAPGAMPAQSEAYAIPGNADLPPQERLRRTEAIYIPFHARLRTELARRAALAAGPARLPVLVTIHSFTPVFHGQMRSVEFGVIHDADPNLAQAVVDVARENTTLITALNEPYSAADGVTHTLRLQATSCGIQNVMLEIRNDLIATPEAQERMAETLAPVLIAALARVRR